MTTGLIRDEVHRGEDVCDTFGRGSTVHVFPRSHRSPHPGVIYELDVVRVEELQVSRGHQRRPDHGGTFEL